MHKLRHSEELELKYAEGLRLLDEYFASLNNEILSATKPLQKTEALYFSKAMEDRDASLVEVMAWAALIGLAQGKEPTAVQKLVTALALNAFITNPDATRAAFGWNGRGAPPKGSRLVFLACEVFDEVDQGGATSIEKAVAAVAERHNVSTSSVDKAWRQAKQMVLAEVAAFHDIEDGEMHLEELKQRNRAAKK